ncbi:ABC transporter permease [Secundilactobacillus collinoides]|uniref:Transport permease protein n=2 Tax=Secundilactobacillus collinoides TaxID=33960 RepID=A0A0R2BBV7_SECCO|nr:ABC transporter permease [Secundilactobacillus collinoides]KRM76599.1 ABC-2 type transporter [Secundilactobacillus collinoides DSM 20515 = JCM 1123]KZL42662.1 Teichoic acid translocation permease TagG [Secundilactobacillus collinoides]
MKEVITLFKEQFKNMGIVFRISRYEDMASYQSHYLGLVWEYLYPLIQICIYWLVFGVGLKHGTSSGVDYLPWMVIGITPWFFMNRATLDASKSIYQRVNMVSKMKFPVSVLPSIRIISNLSSFWTMLVVSIFVGFLYGVRPNLYWFQSIYYFFAMMMLMLAFGIFNSAVSVLIRDYHILLQSVMRILFYLSGVLFNFETGSFPPVIVRIMQVNPFFYVVSGFRETLFGQGWFWQRPTLTLSFWFFVLFFLLVGSHLHYKFRARFVDLI